MKGERILPCSFLAALAVTLTPRAVSSDPAPAQSVSRAIADARLAAKEGRPNLIGGKIIGGSQATPGADPWQVALILPDRQRPFAFCGGSIVAGTWVVTAAHCVDQNTAPSDVDVLVGTVDLDHGGARIHAQEIHVNPNWNPIDQRGDVALIKLAAPTTPRPVTLVANADAARLTAPGLAARITGWGATAPRGDGSRLLMALPLALIDNADCNNRVSYNGRVAGDMICAGFAAPGHDSCQGDSGGPLTVAAGADRVLIGIASWGDGCAIQEKPGVYARTAPYSEWISKCVAGQSCPSQ